MTRHFNSRFLGWLLVANLLSQNMIIADDDSWPTFDDPNINSEAPPNYYDQENIFSLWHNHEEHKTSAQVQEEASKKSVTRDAKPVTMPVQAIDPVYKVTSPDQISHYIGPESKGTYSDRITQALVPEFKNHTDKIVISQVTEPGPGIISQGPEPGAPPLPAPPALPAPLPLPAPPPPQAAPQQPIPGPQQPSQAVIQQPAQATPQQPPEVATRTGSKTILINFNNVTALEFVRFISKISGRNFIFDEDDLRFQVTIVSEEPTTFDNIMAALLQELRIHGLSLTEQGNNIIIHKNPDVTGISGVVSDSLSPEENQTDTAIVTRLFRLNTADPDKIAAVLKPLMSSRAIVEVFKETNDLIITDITANVDQAALIVKSLDAPNNGLVIGQYVVRNGFLDGLVALAQNIMHPISQSQTLIFVPHRAVNSIFIVSTPFVLERTMALLQYLDQNQGVTRIFNLKDLKYIPGLLPEGVPGAPGVPGVPGAGAAGAPGVTPPGQPARPGQWELDSQGNWIFRPSQQAGVPSPEQPPQGYWYVDDQGNWHFQLGTPPTTPQGPAGVRGPEGQWRINPEGVWFFQLAPGKSISPERLARPMRGTAELPAGHIERTQFYIYKLEFRKGDQIVIALGRIAESLARAHAGNLDILETISSIQWIPSSNSLIFTGVAEVIEKMKALIAEIDTPLHQVYIEMLILETTLDDSLRYDVQLGSRFGGGNTSGAQAFLTQGSTLPLMLATTPIGQVVDASPAFQGSPIGFIQGVVGRSITHCGLQFDSIASLVAAVHTRIDTNVIITPRLLVEDNTTAEIFVGQNIPYPSQSIANNFGTVITQNFDYRDVGTLFRVTPQISENGIITLTIEQEDQTIAGASVVTIVGGAGPITNKNSSKTRVHLPDGYFLIISGMIRDQENRNQTKTPCVGSIAFIGAAFRDDQHRDQKNNLMIFIRPKIVDTSEEIDNITKHQQDVWDYYKARRPDWEYETDKALEFLNLPTCEECDDCCSYRDPH